MPFFEFVPPGMAESRLRRELVLDELALRTDGTLSLPARPGLGIELDRDVLAEFSEAALRLAT
jgi:L-alanine-DL-glutamate epimerase-like enolase superfamily enzyme